jgi:hypothetical protein
MSDTTDGGTGRDERTLRDEALAARLAEATVAARFALASAQQTHRAAVGEVQTLEALAAIMGAPTAEELKRAAARLMGGAVEKADAAPPKPRIITDERDAPGC